MLFISSYSSPLCHESSDTPETENRLQRSMNCSWLGTAKVGELEEQAKCVTDPLWLAHSGFWNLGRGGRRLVFLQVMTQPWVWKYPEGTDRCRGCEIPLGPTVKTRI